MRLGRVGLDRVVGYVEHDGPIVLICGSGSRAEQARSRLAPTGLGHLSVLHGGITDWQ